MNASLLRRSRSWAQAAAEIDKGQPCPKTVTQRTAGITRYGKPIQLPSIKIKPFQGENSLAAFNKRLGHFEVMEIASADPGGPLIQVTFHVDAQGALSITAKDAGTGRELPVLRR